MPKERSRHHESSRRRSTSNSSDSSYEVKKSKSKSRRRSRSRDRSEISYKRKKHRRSHSRSSSKDHYSRSSRRSKHSSRRSSSRDRSRSLSSSRSKTKSHKSKRSRRRSSSSRSRSPGIDSKLLENKKFLLDDKTKVEKAIQAAKAAGLTMKKIPTFDYKEVPVKEEMPSVLERNVLNEINTDSFVPKSFVSSKSKKFSENIIIDLKNDTMKVPEVEPSEDESLIKLNELPSEEELREMWYKKLYLYRKKMLKGE